ncbi:MAG: hypothetical protein JWM32_2553 [Verrucomicrobia bacterium]|nr:hypothetical protein [Verrucomicrobiota bacterium]
MHLPRPSRVVLSFLAINSGLVRAARGTEPPAWRESGAAFAAGTLGNSGQNLYVNHRGELEVIHRYDLDHNGYLDLLFNNTHDMYHALPATLAVAGPHQTLKAANLEVDGSSRVIPCDLNCDGFTDLVIMPNPQNVQQPRSSMMIAWGGDDGWSSRRLVRQLPVNGVTAFAVADLNHDGWPDILTLNSTGWMMGQPTGRILRTYWGGPEGFAMTNYQDLGVPNAMEVVCGAFGPAHEFVGAVVTSEKVLLLSPDGPKGLKLGPAIELPATKAGASRPRIRSFAGFSGRDPAADRLWVGTESDELYEVKPSLPQPSTRILRAGPAWHLAVGRLDDDAWPDLVVTNRKLVFPKGGVPPEAKPCVTVFWGGEDGINLERRKDLTIANAIAATIGDLDEDGHADLLVAVYQGDKTTQGSSLVLFGDGTRALAGTRAQVSTTGPQDVALARLKPGVPPTAIFTGSLRRTLDDAVPLRLYWGAKDGFSTSRMSDIPNLSGYKSSASDLNSDGFVDMIVINGGDVTDETLDRTPDYGINIYWGGPEGAIAGPGPNRFDASRRQVLHEKSLGSINVADLNRDGYLDLVLGTFEHASNPDAELVIYFGGPQGYRREQRQVFPVKGRSTGCLIGDFNRDGYLDITVNSYTANLLSTYWGSTQGYSDQNKTVLPYPAPIDLEAADLNGDGWLDLLVASYEDPVTKHHDTGFSIFWGSPTGWTQSNSQWLPGSTPVGLAVADLDGDGHLDIVMPSYHGELSREHLPSYIFWGSDTGFLPLNRTPLIINSASEVVIADFNHDGKLDLAFAAHSVDAGHLVSSPIFFNDGNRFQAPAVQYLPSNGPHYMWVQDIGNLYNRRNEETFTSHVLNWSDSCRHGRLQVTATASFGAQVRTLVRSSPDASSLEAAPWRKLTADSFDLAPADRRLQYRLELVSANGDAYPIVRQVDVQIK